MVSLPPDVNTKLFYDGVWNDISGDLRLTQALEITRGISSEGSTPDPVEASALLNNRHLQYSPRNPTSPLFGKIGRNTPIQFDLEEGGPYLLFPSGIHSVSTPDAASLDVLGDIDVRMDVQPNDWGSPQMLAIRWAGGGNLHYSFAIGQNREIWFWWSPTGLAAATVSAKTTVPAPFYDDQRVTVRVTVDVNNGASGNTTTFYYADALEPEEWIPIGDPVVNSGTTSLFNATAPLYIGDNQVSILPDSSSGISRLQGKAYGLQVRDGIDGTLEVDLDVATNAVAGGTTFTGTDGRVWTRSGTSSLSNVYTRFVGEVPAWPPLRHLTGNDKTTAINPTGITRRLDAGNKPIESALLRYIKAQVPIECWPLTDGETSTVGLSLVDGQDMIVELNSGSLLPEWGKESLADWLEPVVTLKRTTSGNITGGVPNSISAAAAWSVDYFFKAGGEGDFGTMEIRDRGEGSDADNVVYFQLSADQGSDNISIFRFSRGDSSSSFALISTVASPGIFDGEMHHIRFSMDPGASNSIWTVYVDGVQKDSGTLAGIVVKAVRTISFNWSLVPVGAEKTDEQLGYITYWDGAGPSASEIWDAATGLQGERAGTRIERLATEANVVAAVQGDVSTQVQMGIQQRQKFVDLVQTCATSDLGYALEKRDANAIWYRSHVTLYNQTPVFTLDFSNGVVGAPFKPVDDDKLSRNDVSVQRESGGVPSRQVLEEGTMSVQDPPLGIGRYDVAYERNLYTDDLAAQLAYQYLHLGTFDGLRYTKITLDLANPRVYAMIHKILRADVGDKIRITNLPEDLPPDDVDLLILGYTEEIGADVWRITFNCIPGEPWNVGITDDFNLGRADADNCTLSATASSSAGSITVTTSAGSAVWVNSVTYPEDFPFDVMVAGERMTVTSVGTQLTSNPGFETGTTGWTSTNSTLTQSDEVARIGQYSGKIVSGAGSSPRAEHSQVAVVTGQSYTLAGWLYAPVVLPTVAAVAINWYDASHAYLSTSTSSAALAPGVWTEFSQSYTAPASAAFAGLHFLITGTPGTGYALHGDNLVLIDNANVDSTSPQTMNVTRSMNGVVKSHTSGEGVSLFKPTYVAL